MSTLIHRDGKRTAPEQVTITGTRASDDHDVAARDRVEQWLAWQRNRGTSPYNTGYSLRDDLERLLKSDGWVRLWLDERRTWEIPP